MPSLTRSAVLPLIKAALREDRAFHDVTSRALLPSAARVRARIIAKAPGVLAGGPIAVWMFRSLDPSLRCALRRREGSRFANGETLVRIEGRARSIFAAERTALNLLAHLCGIATLTQKYVRRVRPFGAKIFDTRKTLPGLRTLEKYAVRVGGGTSHRSSLEEAILIKTNHLRAMASPRSIVHGPRLIQKAVEQARQIRPKRFVEVEVTNLREFKAALRARPDAILLDNWTLPAIRQAVALRTHGLWTMDYGLELEVSGGVTLANVRAIARTGIDRISIGRLTHSVHAVDLSLEVS